MLSTSIKIMTLKTIYKKYENGLIDRNELYVEVYNSVREIIDKTLGNVEFKEDMLQDVLEMLIANENELNFQFADLKVMNYVERNSSRYVYTDSDIDDLCIVQYFDVDKVHMRIDIQRFLNIRERKMDLIRYRFWDDMTLSEISKTIHKSPETIRQKLAKEIRVMRRDEFENGNCIRDYWL